jgi:formimidoylglutamase
VERFKSFYQSKKDPLDPRLGDLLVDDLSRASKDSLDSFGLAVMGFPCDRGVVANGGREGARLGPSTIRNFFYRLTPHPLLGAPDFIFDFGDVGVEAEDSLKVIDQKAYRFTQDVVESVSRFSNLLPIGIGGGHEFGYSSLKPFLDRQKEEWIVINVDAHLDVRPFSGIPHSGTPFYRLAQDIPNFGSQFLEWGIQPSSCSPFHLKWLLEKGATVSFAGDSEEKFDLWLEDKMNSIGCKKKIKCYLSVDIDAFAASLAPGCSAPQPLGINFEAFQKLLKKLISKTDLVWLGIFEVAPTLDSLDQRTSRLAAQILFNTVTELLSQKYKRP